MEWLALWPKIRLAAGSDVLADALRLAEAHPLTPALDRTAIYARFVSLVAWLQVLLRSRDIALPVRALGDTLGVRRMTISRCIQFAIHDGYLERRQKHIFTDGVRRAARYRFALDRFEGLLPR